MATFIGSTQGGILGSFLATLGVVLPSFIIILLIAALLGFTDIYSALAPDPKSILVFAILWLTHFGYKRIKKLHRRRL